MAIRAIKEHQEIIENQSTEIEALKKKNQELENRLRRIEAVFENAFKKIKSITLALHHQEQS